MKRLKPYHITGIELKQGAGHGATGSYSLCAVTTPGGRSFYFMCAYRRKGREENVEVSPVIASDAGSARRIFQRLAGPAQVAPEHLVDVILDLRLSETHRSPGRAAAADGAVRT